jgi:GNAT superfamily N-acetyltransferase
MAPSDPALAHESVLRADEIAAAEDLVREAGWNETRADWRIFLDLGTVYAVRDGAGRLVATAATLPYGGRFAWISMVIVTARVRRQGIAQRLLRRCVSDIAARGLIPVLDATPAGRAVYLGLGFHDTWSFQRFACPAWRPTQQPSAGTPDLRIRLITDADWSAVCAYDTKAFGADRRPVLERFRGRVPSSELAAFRGEHLVGFLIGRDGLAATQIGPLVADDDATALALLERGLAGVQGPVYLDLADAKAPVRHWLETRGFAPQRPFTRMVHGRTEAFNDPARTYVVAGPELG